MGQGLGRNSPVVLSLGKENYEALIDRHGQWVRWRISAKCPCVGKNSQQPDLHCKKCGGLGFTYSYQKDRIVTQTVMVKDTSGIIELNGEFVDCPLVKVYDNSGVQYLNAEKKGGFVILNSEIPPEKGTYVTAVMVESILRHIDVANCSQVGNGYFRVNGLREGNTSVDGVYHTVPGDIENIEKIVDANGVEYKAKEFRQDMFYIEPTRSGVDAVGSDEASGIEQEIPIAEPLTAFGVDYIPPFIFLLLNQNLNKADEQFMKDLNGDAVLTFPYNCDVSNDDVITVLSGTYTQKSVVAKKRAEYDVIGAYFVDEIVSCVGTEREYENGVDFILVGTNRLKWICDDCPDDGEAYSITCRVFPTYKVVKSIPQIRTSENQRMPKKAVVKLFDTYSEMRGVNRQTARNQ